MVWRNTLLVAVYCMMLHHRCCLSLEFTGWPGICRAKINDSCTLQWTVTPAIPTTDDAEQNIYYGTALTKRVITHIANPPLIIKGDEYQHRNVTFTAGGHFMRFTLNDIIESDASNYTCQYKPFAIGTSRANSNGVIFVWGQPTSASLTPSPSQVSVGERVTYTCDVGSTSLPADYRPQMTYTWYLNDTVINGQTSNTLTINPILRRQWGNRYSCRGQETGSPYSSMSGTVGLKPGYTPGQATPTPRDIQVTEASSVTLECILSDPGYPVGSFRWTRLSDNQVITSCTTGTCQVSASQAGIYTYQCLPYNVVGDGGGATVNLTVVYLKLLTLLPVTTTANTSQTLRVSCQIKAFPASDITWTYNGSPSLPAAVRATTDSPTSDGNYYVTRSTIGWTGSASQQQKETSGGTYTCRANNAVELTEVATTTELHVQFPPRINITIPRERKDAYRKGDNFTFSVSVTASPRPTQNSFIWTFIPTETLSTQALPENANPSVTGQAGPLTITSASLDNLGQYRCLIDNGIGDDLNVTFTLTAESVPDAPTDLSLVKATSFSLTVGWTPGWDGGSDQTFSMTYTNTETGEQLTHVSDLPYIKVTNGIIPDTKYMFEVKGVNTFGAGKSATALYTSPAQPFIDLDNLNIEIYSAEGYAIMRGTIQQGTVTHMVVDACQTSPSESCISNNTTQINLSRRRRSLPVGEVISAKINITEGGTEYHFELKLYDGTDLVNSQRKDSQTTGSLNVVGIAVGIVFTLAIAIVVVVGVLRGKKIRKFLGESRRRQRIYEEPIRNQDQQGNVMNTTYVELNMPQMITGRDSTTTTYENVVMGEKKFSLQVEYLVSEGKSYNVEKAKVNKTKTVAVKTVKENSVCQEMAIDILRSSIRTMRKLRIHENIVKYIGCTGPSGELALVTMFCERSDLNQYLKQCDSDSTYYNVQMRQLTPQKIINMSREIVAGMIFLHSQDPVILHPHLSSYHVAMDGNGTCRLFGFLQHDEVANKYNYDKIMEQLPVRWMAPEVLKEELHTKQSDVWSFGVLLWEILSPGKLPYPDIKDVKSYVLDGNKLRKPPGTDDLLSDICDLCWMQKPRNRPSFNDINLSFEGINHG